MGLTRKRLLTLADTSEIIDVISGVSIAFHIYDYQLFNVALPNLLLSSYYIHFILPTFYNFR